MGKVGYDPFEGFDRLGRAAEHIDAEAAKILTYHAALEAEIDVVLGLLLPRAEMIRSIGFANKVKVLGASWIGDAEAGMTICNALRAFNELRNTVAHHDAKQRRGARQALVAAMKKINPAFSDDDPIDEIAQSICLFIGDGPTKEAVSEWQAALAEVAKQWQTSFAPLAEAMKGVSDSLSASSAFAAALTRER